MIRPVAGLLSRRKPRDPRTQGRAGFLGDIRRRQLRKRPVALALAALSLVLDAEVLLDGAFRALDLAVELVARLAVGELGRRVQALVGLLRVVLGQRLGLVLEAAELTHQISPSCRGCHGPLARPAGPAPSLPSVPAADAGFSPPSGGSPDGLRGAVTGHRRKATMSRTPATDRPRRTPTLSARKPMDGGPARKAR